jgi:hypothetical protein
MNLSREAEKELIELSKSVSLRRDMEYISGHRHNPFVSEGMPDDGICRICHAV